MTREDTFRSSIVVFRNFINILDSGVSVLINFPIDSKLDMLSNALETKLKLKMTLTIGRSGKIEKG